MRNFPADFCTRNFLGPGQPLCRHSIHCCFVSRSWWYNQVSSMVTSHERKSFGSRRKKIKFCSGDWHRWHILSAFRHFGIHFAESIPMSKSSWMMDPSRSREMASCSAIDLAEIWRSSKINSWNWSIFSGMVTVFCRAGRGASQMEKSQRLNWRWHTMVHVPLMFLSEWREFPSAPCLERKKKNLMTARFSMLLKSHASSYVSLQPL